MLKLLKTRPFAATNNHNIRIWSSGSKHDAKFVVSHSLLRPGCVALSRITRTRKTNGKQNAGSHPWTVVCRHWQKGDVFLSVLSWWDSDISLENGTNFPKKLSQSWLFLLWDCCLSSAGPQILIQRSVPEQICSLAADHLQSSLHLSWFTDSWWPVHLFKAKYCAVTWWHFYNEYLCCTGEACFLKISVEISIVSVGTWSPRSPHYDCVKCFTLTFLSKNNSKVN